MVCLYNCTNKTSDGYCKTTACINPQYQTTTYTVSTTQLCGKWITFQYAKSKHSDWKCSNCNKQVFNSRDRKYKYCPYCGSYNTCDDTSREEGDVDK